MSVTLMLRLSLIIVRIGSMPSAVAGIFTYRFGSSMASWSWRAEAIVPASSRARSGATSTET